MSSISNRIPSARIDSRTLEVRGKPQEVAVYDFAKLKAQYAEHVNGTGYPGSYRLEGSLTDTQKVSLTFDADGKVQMLSKHYEPDPELGGVSGSEPTRYDPVRNLFPDELATLTQTLKALAKTDPAYATILERLTGKALPAQTAPAGVGAQHLTPNEGKPLSNGGTVRGAGFEVAEKAKPQSAKIGEKTMEVRGQPQAVPVYDFSGIKPQWAEHVDGTGYPGSYRVEGSLTQTQKVSLTVDSDGSVQLASKHYEPDPELGGVSGAEPTRYDVIRKLFPEELASLRAGLKAFGGNDDAFATVLERLNKGNLGY